jgi:hypothetical protein
MARSRAHRQRARRPSLRLSGGLLVATLALVAATMGAGPSVAVADTAHSGFLGTPFGATFARHLPVFLQSFFRRDPRGGFPAPHRPPTGGPTPAPTTTTSAPPPSGTTTPATTTEPPTTGGPNTNCTLIVPPGALTAAGLATPYRFTATDPAAGPCHEANPDQSAFVEAAILDPATGAVSVYHPLVIDDGTQPAALPWSRRCPRARSSGSGSASRPTR